MTIIYTIQSNYQGQGNYRLRKQRKKQQKLQEKYKELNLSRKIERIRLGTNSDNVAKALSMPTVKSSKPKSSSCCLHEIFIFAVKSGVPENITAR